MPNNRILAVDYVNDTLINYNLRTGRIREGKIPGIPTPSFMIPLKCQKNLFLVSNHLTTAVIEWNGFDAEAKVIRNVFSVETDPALDNNNWLPGKASPQYVFYGGTYRRGMCGDTPPTAGAVYSYDNRRGVRKIIPNIKVASDFQWNKRGNTMYVVDGCRNVIWAYNYNRKTGNIC